MAGIIAPLPPSAILYHRDFFRRQPIQRIDQPVNLGFEGAGVGGGVALFGGEYPFMFIPPSHNARCHQLFEEVLQSAIESEWPVLILLIGIRDTTWLFL